MLNLMNLRLLLSQVLSPSGVQTAALFTPEGQLVSYASDNPRSKDEIRVIIGLSSEIWQETRDQKIGMADSELGRLLVLPVDQAQKPQEGTEEEDEPLLLLALNAASNVSWDTIEGKARQVVQRLEKPVSELRGKLATSPISLANSPPSHRTGR